MKKETSRNNSMAELFREKRERKTSEMEKSVSSAAKYTAWIYVAIIAVLVVLIFVIGLLSSKPKQDSKAIQSLNIGGESEQFVLGVRNLRDSGLLKQTTYTVNIQRDTGFVLETLLADDVEIIETDEVDPHIEGCFKKDGSLFKPNIETLLDSGVTDTIKYEKYKLYVPKGYKLLELDKE